jgi:hypothetical protein
MKFSFHSNTVVVSIGLPEAENDDLAEEKKASIERVRIW